MAQRARLSSHCLASLLLCLAFLSPAHCAADSRFDLVGPKIDVRVTRDGVTLPIAAVPNLQPGDRLWLHPDLPSSQSVKYLLICVFLRGTTNPPPSEWFTRIETWDRHVREEGTFVTVPKEAQQVVLFLAPETGGDFSTLKSAVQGRPGAFVRAQQDLLEAGFEQARIEKYLVDIRRVPPSDAAELQKHSDLLARTLALKPNADCFKRPPDMQFSCLTQSGSQIVLDDGHGHTISDALSGSTSDLINQATYTQTFGGGVYSAYVGAIVDVVHILSNLHTAQYQYIPAISFPQAEQMNLRLNTPPSFHNPKSVLVIALPAVQAAVPPPLRPSDPNQVACLIKPSVILAVEGAPLVFSSDFAHDLVLHLNTPPGAPSEPDIALSADAYYGGLVLQQTPQHHVPLADPGPQPLIQPAYEPGGIGHPAEPNLGTAGRAAPSAVVQKVAKPVTLTGTVRGRWGFDSFAGPTLALQQLPGSGWHILPQSTDGTQKADATDLIAGHTTQILLASTGTACVESITARPEGTKTPIHLTYKLEPPKHDPDATPPVAGAVTPAAPVNPDPPLSITLPLGHDVAPGDLHLAIQQYDEPKPDVLATRTFSEPAAITSVDLHAGDRFLTLEGKFLSEIDHLTLGALTFTPAPASTDTNAASGGLRMELPANAPAPTTQAGEHLMAQATLRDGRSLSVPVTVAGARPALTLLNKSPRTSAPSVIALTNPDDLPLASTLTFTLKSSQPFPRNGQIDIETLDGTLRAVLTLAPSGGLLLQDPHTVVATLDPLRAFGPSAFGELHLRAEFPGPVAKATEGHDKGKEKAAAPMEASNDAEHASNPNDTMTSDWLPLATLVRLPTLTQLQCPADATQACTLTGGNLFLLQALSTDPTFADPVAVPDGYTGDTLTVAHPAAGTIFLRLRDDPAPIDSAIFPTPPPTASVRLHHGAKQTVLSGAGPATSPDPAPAPASKVTTPQ